jgi:hypothetical protein
MKYEVIKAYFEKGIDGLADLLKDTTDVRDAIEDYTQQLMQNIINTADDYKEALNKFDGYYGFVALIAGVAEVYADSQEANELLNAKNKALAEGSKPPTDEVAKSMARVNSAEYQRIANLFDRYARICEKRMMTVQSQLNRIEFEIKSKNDKINH